jgi:hypothetical protein
VRNIKKLIPSSFFLFLFSSSVDLGPLIVERWASGSIHADGHEANVLGERVLPNLSLFFPSN